MNIEGLIGIAITIAIFSILWKENIVFRFVEYTFIGYAAAISVVSAWQFLTGSLFQPLMSGNAFYLMAVILGLLVFTRLSKKYSWMAKWSMAFIIGTSLGTNISAIPYTILSTIRTISGRFVADSWNGIWILAGLITTISYFIYTREHTGILGRTVSVGRYFMVVLLGVMFSTQAMTRLTYSAGRIQFVLKALGLIP